MTGPAIDTATACHDLPITVLRHSYNLGKAAALWRGMQYALDQKVTAIVTLDGDGQHEPEDIPALIALHRQDPLAIVIGARFTMPATFLWPVTSRIWWQIFGFPGHPVSRLLTANPGSVCIQPQC